MSNFEVRVPLDDEIPSGIEEERRAQYLAALAAHDERARKRGYIEPEERDRIREEFLRGFTRRGFARLLRGNVTVIPAIESVDYLGLFDPLSHEEIMKVVDGSMAFAFGRPDKTNDSQQGPETT